MVHELPSNYVRADPVRPARLRRVMLGAIVPALWPKVLLGIGGNLKSLRNDAKQQPGVTQ